MLKWPSENPKLCFLTLQHLPYLLTHKFSFSPSPNYFLSQSSSFLHCYHSQDKSIYYLDNRNDIPVSLFDSWFHKIHLIVISENLTYVSQIYSPDSYTWDILLFVALIYDFLLWSIFFSLQNLVTAFRLSSTLILKSFHWLKHGIQWSLTWGCNILWGTQCKM